MQYVAKYDDLEVVRQFQNHLSAMLNDPRCTIEKLQTETGNRAALMNRFATIAFEPFIEVVGKQLDEKVYFVGGKVARSNPVNGKAVWLL